jgi:hypothetical protein
MLKENTQFWMGQICVMALTGVFNLLSSIVSVIFLRARVVMILCIGFTITFMRVYSSATNPWERIEKEAKTSWRKSNLSRIASRSFAIIYILLLGLEFASIAVLTTQQKLIKSNPSSANITWIRNWGGNYRDYAYDTVFDDGALYVTGDSYSYQSGPVNLFILKYSRDGVLAWTVIYSPTSPILASGTSQDHASRGRVEVSNTITLDSIYTMGRGIASDGNSLYVCGICTKENSSYSLLLKLDKDGNIIWVKQWNPEHDTKSTGVALDVSGNIYVTGYVAVSASMNHGYLLKYNGEGALLFSRVFDSDYTETSWGISVSNAVYLCGEAGYNNSATNIPGLFKHNMFLTKIDFEGNLIWSKKYSSGYNNVANSVDAKQEISVAGYTKFDNGTSKIVLLRYSPEGDLRYSKIFGESNAEDVAWGIVVAGQFTYVVGHTCPYFHHPADASICKLGPDGDVLWWDYNWGEIRDRALSVTVSDDEVYVVGETFQSGVDSQVFVTKYESPNFILSPNIILSLKLAPLIIGCLFLILNIYVIIRILRRLHERQVPAVNDDEKAGGSSSPLNSTLDCHNSIDSFRLVLSYVGNSYSHFHPVFASICA